MENKLNELLKMCASLIARAEKGSMFGVVEYLEEAQNNIQFAIEEFEEFEQDYNSVGE